MSTTMARSALPSTPTRTPPSKPPSGSLPSTPKGAISTPSPGTWSHPALAEIKRRQTLTRFDESNVRRIIFNAVALVVTFILGSHLCGGMRSLSTLIGNVHLYPTLQLWAVRLLLVSNIGFAFRPLFLPEDQLTDIPLTPSQRALLGLKPHSSPVPAPGTKYITPPRYRKSSSRSGTPTAGAGYRSGSGSISSSPLSGRSSSYGNYGTPGSASAAFTTPGKLPSGSPFSPTDASPLWQKAVGVPPVIGGGPRPRDLNRRHSLSTSTAGFGQSTGSAPGTPSPIRGPGFGGGGSGSGSGSSSTTGARPGPWINNKWLYEKSRNSVGSTGSSGLGMY